MRKVDSGGTIRSATPEDLKVVLDILNITNRAFYRAIVPPEAFREPYLAVDELAGEFKRKDFYLYELEGKPIGVAAFEARDRGVVVVDRVYVLPDYQRRGIGAALLTYIERQAAKRGVREIVLWTDSKAIWAIRFYKRLGYSEIDRAAVYDDATIDERVRQHGRKLLVLRKTPSIDSPPDLEGSQRAL